MKRAFYMLLVLWHQLCERFEDVGAYVAKLREGSWHQIAVEQIKHNIALRGQHQTAIAELERYRREVGPLPVLPGAELPIVTGALNAQADAERRLFAKCAELTALRSEIAQLRTNLADEIVAGAR